MEEPLVSIIMPTYNVEAYVGRAIDSVLNQTYQNWELIVVNDGSPDDSCKVVMEYVQKDRRIRLVDKENGGLSDARNYGLQYASGKFVHFFDSDDWIELDFYSRLVPIVKGNFDFVISGYSVDEVDSKENLKRRISKNCPTIEFPLADVDKYIDRLLPFLDFAWNKLYRLEFLRKNGLAFQKGLSRVEDCEFFSRVMECNPKFCTVDYVGYHYMVRPRKTLSNFFDERMLDDCRVRLEASCSIYRQMGCSLQKQRSLLSSCAESSIRAYLHQLFSIDGQVSLTYFWRHTKAILHSEDFRNVFVGSNLKSGILPFGISHSLTEMVYCLYYAKRLFKRIRCCLVK